MEIRRRRRSKSSCRDRGRGRSRSKSRNRSWSRSKKTVATCGAMLISGQAAFLAILILSDKEEVAAWAQHDPQYWGEVRFRMKEFNV